MEKRTFADLDVVIENPKGSTRHWHDRDGRVSGSTEMQHDYGFLDGHVGSDGEEVDCYLGPDETAPMVFVVHQLKAPAFKMHDEDKVFLGFADEAAAKAAYVAHRNDGERAYGGMTSMSIERFKQKLRRRTGDGKIRHEVTPMMMATSKTSGSYWYENRITEWPPGRWMADVYSAGYGKHKEFGSKAEALAWLKSMGCDEINDMTGIKGDRPFSKMESRHGRLMAFDSLRGADGAVRAHVWDYVCVEGHDEKEGQATDFNIATLSEMVDNFVGRGDQIPIDWNHQSNYASQNGQPAPALGFYGALAVVWDGKIVKTGQARGVDGQISSEGLDLSKNGLWAYRCEVTELGNQLLPNFKYVSPMFTPEGTERDGTPVGYSLVAVAATNTPWQGGTAISFEQERAVIMATKKTFGPLPDGIEVHWLPVNQAYLVTWKGQRVAGPFSENDLRDWLLRFKDWKPGTGMDSTVDAVAMAGVDPTRPQYAGEAPALKPGARVRSLTDGDTGKVIGTPNTSSVQYISDKTGQTVTIHPSKIQIMDNARAAANMSIADELGDPNVTHVQDNEGNWYKLIRVSLNAVTVTDSYGHEIQIPRSKIKATMDNTGAAVAMDRRLNKGDRITLKSGAPATVIKDDGGDVVIEEDGYPYNKAVSRQAIRSVRTPANPGGEPFEAMDITAAAVNMAQPGDVMAGSIVEVSGKGRGEVIVVGDAGPRVRFPDGDKQNVPWRYITKVIKFDKNMDNSGQAAASHKGAGRMSKLAGVARILKMEGDPPDADVKKALEAKMDSDAVAAMEEEAYDHNGAADSLEQLARAYEDSNYEEEGDETPPHVVMRKMAAKFRRLGKMGDPPFGGKETPSEEAAEGHAMAKHEDPEMAKHEKEEEESPKLAAMQATVTALGAKLAKFEAIEASREKAIRDERERGYEQLADQAVAGGYPKAKRGALINFARSDFEGARATVEHFLPKGTPIGLFDRVSKGGEPIGGPTTGRGRDMGTPAAPRRVQAMGRVFVEDDGEYASEIMSMAKSKDPIVMERLDQHLSEGERGMLYKRLLAARKVVSQERPDLAASE